MQYRSNLWSRKERAANRTFTTRYTPTLKLGNENLTIRILLPTGQLLFSLRIYSSSKLEPSFIAMDQGVRR
jgi:hypothetical protein